MAHFICFSLWSMRLVNDAPCPLSRQLEPTQIRAPEDESLILRVRCVLPWQAVKDREEEEEEGRCWWRVIYKIAEQSLVTEAEKEPYKPWGGFESDSSRAIREVKQLIIT